MADQLEADDMLYGELAAGLAMPLYGSQETKSTDFIRAGCTLTVAAPYYCHDFMSTFENASDILWRLGILISIDPDNRWGCAFHFAVSPENFFTKAIENRKSGPVFEEILSAFFYFRSDLPFAIRDDEMKLYSRLKSAGYVASIGQEYQWTEKADPILKALGMR